MKSKDKTIMKTSDSKVTYFFNCSCFPLHNLYIIIMLSLMNLIIDMAHIISKYQKLLFDAATYCQWCDQSKDPCLQFQLDLSVCASLTDPL